MRLIRATLLLMIFGVGCAFGSQAISVSPNQQNTIFLKYIHAAENDQYICPSASDNHVQHVIQKAYERYLKQAQAGNAQAQYYVGMVQFYFLPSHNIQSAYGWFLKSALQNNPLAMRQLGGIEKAGGIVVPQEMSKTESAAIKWFSDAYKHGDKRSGVILAMMYYAGVGAKQNKHIYYSIITKLAKAKYGLAELGLANLYFAGEHVQQDYKKALTLYMSALSATDLPTKTRYFIYDRLSNIYKNGLGTARSLAKAKHWEAEAQMLKKQSMCFS